MTLLRSYIMFSVFRGVAIVLAVLIAVTASIEFIAQLNDLGTGSYGLGEAIGYVLLRVPRRIFETLPAAALIGSLLSLGNMAVHRELVIMRSSGISSWQLLGAVGMAGFGLAVFMALLGESLAPSLGAYADEMRTRALHKDIDLADGQSTWLRDGDRILNLRRQAGDVGFGGGVLLFDVGPDHSLKQIARADSADVSATENWMLENYAETTFQPQGIVSRREREAPLTYDFNPDLVALAVVQQDFLDTPALQRYIGYLKANGLDARRYLIALWKRIADVVSVVLMTSLALPFVFGGLRSAGTGGRLLFGLIIGLSYYVIGEVLAQSGAVLLLVTVVAVVRAR
jgi:lipopolysaccharide export system permease protein